MKGYIYVCRCEINDKKYVGITTQHYIKRWKDHIKSSFIPTIAEYNYHFHRAIRKYGKEHFKWDVIETIISECKEDLIRTLKEKEVEYISKFDTYKSGYNSTRGGDTSLKECKSICSYSESGTLLHTFEDVSYASDYYNVSKGVIWSCCNGSTCFALCNSERIVFRYGDDIVSVEYENIHNHHSKISMYDLEGNLIRSFSNPTEASQELNIENSYMTKNCRKESVFVFINGNRYFFRYRNEIPTEEDIKYAKSVKSDPKSAVIAINSITKEIIGKYSSQSEASRQLGVRKNNISEACCGKRKSAGKYNGAPIQWIKQ